MDYAEAREAFFQTRPDDAPAHGWTARTTPGRRLRDALEPVATICYWAEPSYDAYAEVGLDFLGGYVYGRACVLGDADPAVAAAAFGVFEPGLVADLYAAARDTCALGAVRAAKQSGAVASLEQTVGRPDGLGDVVAVLARGADAADTSGRALSAGLAGMARPEDQLAALWHLASLLREHRGDGHLAACTAAGLDGLEANLLTEMVVGWEPLAYTASRGWSEEAMSAGMSRLVSRGLVADGELTDAGRALREDVEDRTDASVARVVEAIGDDLDETVDAVTGWGDAVVERGWFPPDPYKRASG